MEPDAVSEIAANAEPDRAVARTMTKELPDIVAPGLDVLFCGINPALTAAWAGHHFAGRSNRFWRVLYLSGFTPTEMSAEHDHQLLDYGYGITSVVRRATASADELSPSEFAAALNDFERRIARLRPRFVAFLGKAAYAGMNGLRTVDWGLQPRRIHHAAAWLLPNPSGRNRSFSLDRLVDAYRYLYMEVHPTPVAGCRTEPEIVSVEATRPNRHSS